MRSILYDLLNLFPFSNNSRSLKVLAYHTVPDENEFEKQVKFLKENYHLITISDLRKSLDNQLELPENSLLITFDDGDITVYENGFPVLRKLKVPAAIFIITDLIDSNKTFWCRWVEKAYERQGKLYSEARKQVDRLKKVPEEERREYLKSLPLINSGQLTSKQLIELNDNGIFIGNHTHTHPMINKCNEAQIMEEMNAAKSKFEDLDLSENFSVFAYPNGNWEPNSENTLMEEGIEIAFLFDHQVNKDITKINPMRISRIRVNADDDLSEFKVKVSGLHSRILNLRQKIGV
ncbi:polysaccharide deacetylase family protein [Gramella lutea]|uniref:Polysaccharide deacetylase family protein n=1 Tax=Christiangramia lutea TaxID=1607951 RepID=A0A9X1V3I9_9FLAO|nr:polysaccharide deacetylase family protein [Christiangramia lutea]MCH4823802.1 polysaccharide deacetylase family protein [Christiangramia lutea]